MMRWSGLNGAGRAVVERWTPLLQPWQAYVAQVNGIFSDAGPVRVGVCTGSTPRPWHEDVLRCREALELLALIAVVESTAPLPIISKRRFLISSYSRDLPADVPDVEVFQAFFLAFDEHSLRDEFHHAMQQIFSHVPPAKRAEVAHNWRMPVEFLMSTTRHGSNLSVAYLTTALELVKGIEHRVRGALTDQEEGFMGSECQWRYRFPYADGIVKLVISTSNLEHGTAALLAELFALGVCTDEEIGICSNSALGGLPVSELGPVIHALTDGASVRSLKGYERIFRGERDGVLSLEKWQVNSNYHVRRLQAICTSLAVSQRVKKLCISGFGSDFLRQHQQKVLQWLVYALFSSESASCVTHLKLDDVHLEDEDMRGIFDMLEAEHSLKLLLDDGFGEGDLNSGSSDGSIGEEDNDDDEQDDPGFAFVKAGTLIFIAPVEGDSKLELTLESLVLKQDGLFRVIRNDTTREWVDIIVPHYGYCIVSRASVDHFVVDPSATSSRTVFGSYAGSITSLTVTDSNHEVLLPLISYIGPKLLSLSVSGSVDPLFLRHALAACPNLTSVKVVEPEERIEHALMEAYESGQCNVESVRVLEYAEGREQSTIAFIRMLGDPDSAAAKTLRSLELQTMMHHFFFERIFTVLAKMLRINRTIEFLRINMGEYLIGSPYETALMSTHGTRFTPHPLPLKSQFAFLSVLQFFSPGHSTEAQSLAQQPRRITEANEFVDIRRFDQALISLIFAFAAKRAVRRIEIVPVSMRY